MNKIVPVILQNEIAECGLACVAMISSYHGKKTDLPALRKLVDPGTRGATMKDLAELGEALGLSVKSLKLGLKQMDKLALPAILHWNLVHYVVLVGRNGDEYVIHDPALGRRVLSEPDFSRSFTGLAQEFSSRPCFVKTDDRTPVPLRWLVDDAAPYVRLLGAICAMTLVMQLLVGVLPFGAQAVIDRALTDRDPLTLGIGLLFGAVGTGLYCLLLWLRSTVVLYLNSCLDTAGMQKLVAKMLAMPADFFARRDVGGLLSRFANLSEIRRLLTQGFAESAVEALIALLLLAAIALYLPSIGLVSVSTLAVYAAYRALVRGAERDRVGELFHSAAGQNASLIETLTKIETVKANAIETLRERFWLSRFTTHQNSLIRKARINYRNDIALIACFSVGYALTAWFVVRGVFDGLLSMGEAFTVFLLVTMFFSRANQFLERFFELLIAKVYLDNLADVVHGEEEPQQEHGDPGGTGPAVIELRDIGFRYSPKEPFVFRKVSFVIGAGECVAITGPSGCGKSTLLSLLLGLREPTEGEIVIDGLPLRHWDKRRLRRRIGSVLQSDQLFIGSVQENITLFDVQSADQRIHEAIDACALRAVVSRLPMGEHTMIGDSPMLSGGERQRLLLARALYKEPRILLLDEASSHLDEATEAQVNEGIRTLGVTRVMVAHRRQTIDLADTEIRLGRSGDCPWTTVVELRRGRPRVVVDRSDAVPASEIAAHG